MPNNFAYVGHHIFLLRPKTCIARAVASKEEACSQDQRNYSIWFWDPNGRLWFLNYYATLIHNTLHN